MSFKPFYFQRFARSVRLALKPALFSRFAVHSAPAFPKSGLVIIPPGESSTLLLNYRKDYSIIMANHLKEDGISAVQSALSIQKALSGEVSRIGTVAVSGFLSRKLRTLEIYWNVARIRPSSVLHMQLSSNSWMKKWPLCQPSDPCDKLYGTRPFARFIWLKRYTGLMRHYVIWTLCERHEMREISALASQPMLKMVCVELQLVSLTALGRLTCTFSTTF